MVTFVLRGAALALCLGTSLPVKAAPSSSLNRWFCKALREPFDAQRAMAAFPLERLPAARVSLDLNPRIYAAGKDFTVIFFESPRRDAKGVMSNLVAGPLTNGPNRAALAARIRSEFDEWGKAKPSVLDPLRIGVELNDGRGGFFSIARSR